MANQQKDSQPKNQRPPSDLSGGVDKDSRKQGYKTPGSRDQKNPGEKDKKAW